ncbi:hypothetical protein BIW11_11354 [Tropilaelaps mercedesae]|uniref:Multivesicular body subunit 12B-like n=1 Tax=Tropilaelaps mercedesae TaxID=418985 RepID=A0A1V9XBY4_9ACAR|nr:hypothetical protein BIW11_11354 [Tropilaelaps mercedesae]
MEPITDICVVQEAKNAPQGYSVIELTGDVGQDADLWKDKGLFFGRKETRYLCFARKFSLDCVESVSVQVTPPPNVLTISLTRDTGGQSVDQTTLRTYKNSADGRSVAGESTACAKNWIDDIPYQLNAQLLPITRLPVIHLKTASQIYSQFNYDFSLEREILRATPPQDFSSPPNFPGENNGLVDVE